MNNLLRMMQLIERYDKSFSHEILDEAMSTADVYQKYYSNIPQAEFDQIVKADPTSKPNKMGIYCKWLLTLYTAGKLLLEDLYKATEYLTTFTKFKAKIQQKDINQFKSLPDLYNVIQPFAEAPDQATSNSDEVRKAKQGADKVYEDSQWLIIVPHTMEAAKYYGANTQWCTASDNNNMFDEYYSRGELYINIDKVNNRKYQFHFEDEQFKDERDHGIRPNELPLSEGVYLYYKSISTEHFLYLKFGEISPVNKQRDYYLMNDGGPEWDCLIGICNKDAQIIIQPKYMEITKYGNCFWVSDGDEETLFDLSGKMIFQLGKYTYNPSGILHDENLEVYKDDEPVGKFDTTGLKFIG